MEALEELEEVARSKRVVVNSTLGIHAYHFEINY